VAITIYLAGALAFCAVLVIVGATTNNVGVELVGILIGFLVILFTTLIPAMKKV